MARKLDSLLAALEDGNSLQSLKTRMLQREAELQGIDLELASLETDDVPMDLRAVRGESPALHRDRRCACLTRRDEGEYRVGGTNAGAAARVAGGGEGDTLRMKTRRPGTRYRCISLATRSTSRRTRRRFPPHSFAISSSV